MIIVKDLRIDVLGEPLFEKVNLVIRPGERIGVLGSKESDIATFLGLLAGTVEMDEGKVTLEGERVALVSSETLLGGADALAKIFHSRPTFMFIDTTGVGTDAATLEGIKRFILSFRGGILLATENAGLMQAAKVTRVFEIQPFAKAVTSYTGSFADYTVAREQNRARAAEAYEKQQKEKRRLEDWLTQKRKEASSNRSPERGATIRTKIKYLQREILDKELPNPDQEAADPDTI